METCEKRGQIGELRFRHCHFSSEGLPSDSPWYTQEPLYLSWKRLNCKSDCRYHCMRQREDQRKSLGLEPVKYHGKWPFLRVSVFQVWNIDPHLNISCNLSHSHPRCSVISLSLAFSFLSSLSLSLLSLIISLAFYLSYPHTSLFFPNWISISPSYLTWLFWSFPQEPASAVLSAINLIMHFNGWLSFFLHVYYKLPMNQNKKSYYEYTSLWLVYGLLSMNAWFWSAIFHSR